MAEAKQGPSGKTGAGRDADAGTPLDARVEQLLDEPIRALGCRLLEARLRQEGRWVLRLTIERAEGALTLDDCARVSELAGRILDVEDPIPHAFFLEVSSPGVFRPLKERRHFEQSVGRRIRITVAPEAVPGLKDATFRAELKAVEGETLLLEVQGPDAKSPDTQSPDTQSTVLAVPLDAVKKARLDPDL